MDFITLALAIVAGNLITDMVFGLIGLIQIKIKNRQDDDSEE